MANASAARLVTNQPLGAGIDPGDHMQGRPLRVLVVDDNESVRRSICELLRSQANIEVICEAVDGADAVQKAREHRPDLVLLDITMPTMSRLEAARILKRDFPQCIFSSSVSTILAAFGVPR